MQLTDEDLIEMMTQIWDTMIGEELYATEIAADHAFGMYSTVGHRQSRWGVVGRRDRMRRSVGPRLAEVLFSMSTDGRGRRRR
ncbi:MAG: hypothetical protein R2710_02765 [Acidimicrobiales bacterium]